MNKKTSKKVMKQLNQPSTTGTQVYEHIKRNLLEGAYLADEWVPIEIIAKDLGVSRQPVMEAMKRLAVEGFIEIVPQVGCRLRKYSFRDIMDFFQLFALGEAEVARLAAERADKKDVIKLRLISAQIGTMSRLNHSPEEIGQLYRDLNRKLHYEIKNIARTTAVGELVEVLRDRSDYFISWDSRFLLPERVEAAYSEHEAIIDAIENGDGELASIKMKNHILAVEESIVEANDGPFVPRKNKLD